MGQYLRNVWDHTRDRFGIHRAPFYGPPVPLDVPTPIVISHPLRSVILIGVVLAIIVLALQVPSIVQLLLLGATVSLILSFPVGFLNRFMPRGLAITIVTLGVLLFVVFLLALLIPFLINEITRFAESLPATIGTLQSLVNDALNSMYERGWIDQDPESVLEDIEQGLFNTGQQIITDLIGNVLSTLTASVNILITAFGVTFIAIYLLVDIPDFRDSYMRMWAPKYRRDAFELWDTIGYSLSRYLSGLLVSLTLQGVLAWIGLTIIGVPYALILGIVVAATAILPYIGAWISAIPAILIALTLSWQHALAVGILYVVINQVEGNLITPRIQGSAVRVHPLLVFLAVIAGSRIFGIFGAVLAVPVLAVLRVLAEFFWLRLRVNKDKDTVLSAMRADMAPVRIAGQSPIADVIEEADERRRDAAVQDDDAPPALP